MRGVVEYAAFLALSVGAHVLVLTQPEGVGGGAGGQAGSAHVTLAAMPADMGQLVARWTTPPTVQADPVAMVAPRQDAPAAPIATPAAQPPAAAPLAPAMPDRPGAAPGMDSAAPLPLPTPPQAEAPELAAPQPPEIAPRPAAPDAPARPQPAAPTLPQIAQDAAPPAEDGLAPAQSLRPVSRPDRQIAAQPAKPAAQPSAGARPAQKAQGQGGTKRAGAATPKQAAGPGKAQVQQMMAQWGGRVRASVERNKRYPRGTRAEGRVTLRITLSHTGKLQGASVVRSSGHAALDRAALAAVQRTRFPAAPKGMPAGSHRFNLPVAFSR